MGVLYDVATERHLSASAAVRTHTHTATIENVGGILVGFVKGTVATDVVTAVSVGGVNLVRVNRATDTATEPGAAEWWFASGVGSGQLEVIYNTSAPASNLHVVAVTFTSPHTPYILSNQTKGENTTSFSVSLTTGYVSGYGVGAFYGGGAEPATLTYGTDRTLIHDWDMGAFYAEFFRTTSPTAAGSGPVLEFGGNFNTAVSDDVAFAAVFITDGSIDAGRGEAVISGLQPTVIGEIQVGPPVGLVAAGSLVPDISGEIVVTPGVGGVQALGLAPGVVEPLNSHEPTLLTELRQTVGVGTATAAGQNPSCAGETQANCGSGIGVLEGKQPSLLTELAISPITGLAQTVGQIPGCGTENQIGCGAGLGILEGRQPSLLTELAISPITGLAQTGGQIPGKYTELVQGVGLGSVATGGHSPQCLPENAIGCGSGLGIIEGRQPTLSLENIITPSVGLAILEGRLPTVTGDSGTPVVEATAEPGVATLTLGGTEPSLAVEYDKPRGHARRRSRYYGPEYVEVSAKAEPVISLTKPQPVITEVVADFRPDEVLKLDTTATEYRLSEIESRRALVAKRRREEEELMAILMRAA